MNQNVFTELVDGFDAFASIRTGKSTQGENEKPSAFTTRELAVLA